MAATITVCFWSCMPSDGNLGLPLPLSDSGQAEAMFTRAQTGPMHPRYGCGMTVNSEQVYLGAVTAHQLPKGVGVVSLSHLALAFSQMAMELKGQGAPAKQQDAFQGAIAYAAEIAPHLTPSERKAVQNVLHTAFDGRPRHRLAMAV